MDGSQLDRLCFAVVDMHFFDRRMPLHGDPLHDGKEMVTGTGTRPSVSHWSPTTPTSIVSRLFRLWLQARSCSTRLVAYDDSCDVSSKNFPASTSRRSVLPVIRPGQVVRAP